ncbi:DNA mismatch repair protein MutS [Algirhabdus cladophorae]|uniref:DNA mismatch repair protein MutS n=1 Tax=Algirhabdus cladophorae TaxID=3377108 RepID=UPI003B8483BF
MMAQYLGIKEQYPDALLFYRMGDFYELFFDDAAQAAAALDIALTKRGKHDGEEIPMCGVPFHAAETYLQALIKKGFRVAVAEQMESPAEAKKRGGKAVVKRDVVRLVTPGTLTEDALLNAREHNFLASYACIREAGAIAWVDISTGDVSVIPCTEQNLLHELARLNPSEIVISQKQEEMFLSTPELAGLNFSPLSGASFDSTAATQRIQSVYGVATLDGFGEFSSVEMASIGALLAYLDITQKGKLPLLKVPRRFDLSQVMQIDPATRKNLEITTSLNGSKSGSLLHAIDRTVTAGGARLFAQRISAPSRDLDQIQGRLDTVSTIAGTPILSEDIRVILKQISDMTRALSRLSLDRGGPRDLKALQSGLNGAQQIFDVTKDVDFPQDTKLLRDALVGHQTILNQLETTLDDEVPLLARDGGFIRSGFDPALDEFRKLRDDGKTVIAGLQSDYAKLTEVAALKIKHNNVLGYFIETTALHAEKMLSAPLSNTFIHRQTTANAVRFTTVELSELETKILNAGGSAIESELRHYTALKDSVLENYDALSNVANTLAEMDVFCAVAEVSAEQNWCKPVLKPDTSFDIKGGRHPVVEIALSKQGKTQFIANDCMLSANGKDGDIWLLTGPNMAGKSTYLRQNALIAILAQAGMFVPADAATIGVVSQLFSRVGASDDLAQGRSTFMVEMVETAAILNQADERALVILDEIGRGTATYDGLSIAWATLEHLHDVNRCRGLFATHYHEMTGLSDKLERVDNATVAVKEWDGEVIFLHEVRKGAADRSYGVQVAQLAGLPTAVVNRARDVLEVLEKGEREGGVKPNQLIDDLPLFSATPAPTPKPVQESEIEKRLDDIYPDDLTAKEALDLLYELKQLRRP